MPDISILLCTINRSIEVRKCLESIYRQSFSDYEIIVIDQSIQEDQELKRDNRLKYIHITPHGLSNARNEGLKYCVGKYIALVDDDATYDADYLKRAYESLEKDLCVGIVSGWGIDRESNELILKGMKNECECFIKKREVFSYVVSPVVVLRREVVDSGFDEDFGIGGKYNAAEESDIAFSCLESGKKIFYNPNMKIYHPSGNNDNVDPQKVYKYSIGIGAVLKKHYLDTKDLRYIIMYINSLWRSVGGMVLYTFGKKKYVRSKYAFKGKIEGFRSYKNNTHA